MMILLIELVVVEAKLNCVSEWVGHEEMRQRVKKKKKKNDEGDRLGGN